MGLARDRWVWTGRRRRLGDLVDTHSPYEDYLTLSFSGHSSWNLPGTARHNVYSPILEPLFLRFHPSLSSFTPPTMTLRTDASGSERKPDSGLKPGWEI